MNVKKVSICLAVAVLMATLPFPMTWGHEVVGEETRLMVHTKHILTFIKKDRGEEALRMANRIYENFEVNNRIRREEGLKINSLRVDQIYGTKSFGLITDSIKEKDISRLQKGLELLGFLLMVERFDFLQATFRQGNEGTEGEISVFWLGRNYFSHLLATSMGAQDPIEEKQMDRFFERMLYSLEDGDLETFVDIRERITRRSIVYFKLPLEAWLMR